MQAGPERCGVGKSCAASVMCATFITLEEACLKYKKVILVDPLLDVTPVHLSVVRFVFLLCVFFYCGAAYCMMCMLLCCQHCNSSLLI